MRTQSRVLIAAASITVAALALTGCTGGGSGGSGTAAGGTLTIAIPAVPSTWDPYKNDYGAEGNVQQAVYDTLIRSESDGSLAPDLATSWKLVTPTELRLTIRKGVKFSDGSALTPDVVKQNLERAKSIVGPKTDQLSGVTSITVDGDDVTLHMDSPNPAIPLDLSQVMGMMVSPKALASPDTLTTVPAGAGPYVLDKSKTVVNNTYTFTRNPHYWDAKSFPYDTVVMKEITDPTAALNAARSGQVELSPGTAANVSAAKSAGLTILQQQGDFRGLWINDVTGQQVPALKDQRVRQAMLLAIDRSAIVAFIGAGTPTAQIFPKGTTAYDPQLDKKYAKPQVAQAKQLLTQAGYPDGFPLTITSISVFDPDAQAVAQDLDAIGIKTTINDVQLTDFANAVQTAPVYFTTYAPIDTYYDARSILLPNGGFNLTHKSDAQLTALVGQYAAATTPAEQRSIGKQISDRVTQLGWFTVAYVTTNFTYVSKKIDAKLTPFEAVVALWNIKPAA